MLRALLNQTRTIPLLTLIGLSTALNGIGQSRINGIIQDISGRPIAFANVLLLSPEDSMVVKGSVSATDGSFRFDQIEEHIVLLSISLIGYAGYMDQLELISKATIELNPPTCWKQKMNWMKLL